MTISATYRDNSMITADYSANVAVADNTRVASPIVSDKIEVQVETDQVETAKPRGFKSAISQIKDGLAPTTTATGEKDINLWRQQESQAYQNNLSRMAVGNQGYNNSCGTTSEAMALSFFGLPFNGAEDFTHIDKAIRPWNIGAGTPTAPTDIVNFSRQMGMQAKQYSGCSLEDVAKQLRDGRTVTVLTNYESPRCPGTSAGVHYVNITGVERDANGEISQVHIRNPWGGSFANETVSAEDFMKMWSNVRANGKAVGGIEDVLLALPISDRTMIVTDSPDAEPLDSANIFKNMYNGNINTTLKGFNGLAAGVNAIKGKAIGAGLGQITGSAINTVVGGSCYIVGNLIGKNLEEGSDKLMDIGKSMLKGNFLQKVGGGLAVFFGAIGKAVGWVLHTMTNLVSSLTDKLTGFLCERGEKFNAQQALHKAIEEEGDGAARQMESASTGTKVALFNKLVEGGATQAEQRSALQVLAAARYRDDLEAVVKELGGREEILKHFNGAALEDATNLLATLDKQNARRGYKAA